MSSDRPEKPKPKRAKATPDDAVATPAEGAGPTDAELEAQAEIDARAEMDAQASPDDDPETAARKAQRRAELEEARQAKLAKASAKEQERAARAAERARRAVMREEREKANEIIRAEREAAQAEREAAKAARDAAKAEREAAIEKEKADRAARIAAITAEREAREAASLAARKRRQMTPEELAEAQAYANSEPPPRTSVWAFQLRVIKALVLRDMGARFGTRSRLSYLWALLNPILLMIGLIIVFSLRARVSPPNLPLLIFTMTGYPIWFGFYGMWGEISGADRDPNMLMFPQVTVLDLILARFVLELATSTVVYLLLVTGTILIGRVEFPSDFMGLMFAYWGCCWLGFAFGLCICALKRFVPMVEEWMMPVRRMGIFLSGVIFTATSLPSWMLPYLSWNPLFRAIEIARECWHPAYQSPIATPMYVFMCAFALTALGITVERITRRYAGE